MAPKTLHEFAENGDDKDVLRLLEVIPNSLSPLSAAALLPPPIPTLPSPLSPPMELTCVHTLHASHPQGGQDINAVNDEGCTALHLACRWGWDDVVALLLSRGAAVDIKDNLGDTPLHGTRPPPPSLPPSSSLLLPQFDSCDLTPSLAALAFRWGSAVVHPPPSFLRGSDAAQNGQVKSVAHPPRPTPPLTADPLSDHRTRAG